MAGDTPYEAFDHFRQPIQKAFSCVHGEAHLWALGSNGYGPGQEHLLVPSRGEPVPLSGERRLSMTSQFIYEVVRAEDDRGPWKVATRAYYHGLEDENGQEVISYHWHPNRGSAYHFPHLHIGLGIGASLGEVHKYHIPTGRTALEDMLRLVIRDFGVEPQRTDWSDVLDETLGRYETWRTWAGSGPANP